MMKRIFSLILAALVILTVPALASCSGRFEQVTTLYVYNWGEYISDGSGDSFDSNAGFEEWYYETFGERVVVNYSTFSSNEDLYAKLSSGAVSYDVIVPSDYMIERLIKEGRLAPLDLDEIPSISNIAPEFRGEDAVYDYFDKGGVYSVPYMYGMIGIIYNTTMVDEDDEDIGSWNLLWDEDYAGNILQFNNSRDAFGTAQYKIGVDVNSDDENDWRAALDELKAQKAVVQGYVMDEVYNKMENGSAAIAAYYAGDYLTMYDINNDLEFFYPEEGTNLYVDAMCIPANSKNQKIANRYIEYMLHEEPAVANALYTYYASPNSVVRESEDYIEGMEDAYELMYPGEEVMAKATYYENLTEEKLALINELWEELKSDISIGWGIYVICGVILAVLIGLAAFGIAKTRYRAKFM